MTGQQTLDPELEEFAGQIADQIESFLVALQAIVRDEDGGRAISLLLLEVSQVLLAGARLGAQADFTPEQEYQPDVGPDPDLDAMRLKLARMLDGVDTYSLQLRPLRAGAGRLAALRRPHRIATDVANGLRHFRAGNVAGGAVVVAVLLRRLVGQQRQRRAAGAPVDRRPRPARRRLRG